MNNLETTMSNYERHCQARKELGKANKAAIFDALAAANISLVSVEFDGEGDSGQIDNLTAYPRQCARCATCNNRHAPAGFVGQCRTRHRRSCPPRSD